MLARATLFIGTLFFNNIVREICRESSILVGTFDRGPASTACREDHLPPFSAVDYHRYAAECVRLARQVSDPNDKARLLDMAETFRELAERHEARNTRGPDD